jgi:hypothetical protein
VGIVKKRELKEKIAELEKDVDLLRRGMQLCREREEQWRKTASDTHVELVKWLALARNEPVVVPRSANVTMEEAFTKGRQCGGNVLSRLAAEAGQPSMTVTATREEDAPMAEMATKALKVAEGDMAEKLRELLLGGAEAMGGRQALYLNGLTLGLHPTVAMDRARMGAEAWHAKELAEHAASLKQSGIFKETIVRPPIRFYPDNLEEFRVGVGTANAINKWFKDPPLDQNPPDNILNFLQSIVDKVTWCGKVGKVEGLDGEFRYSEGETAFRISYQRVSLGLYELVDGHWFRATKG